MKVMQAYSILLLVLLNLLAFGATGAFCYVSAASRSHKNWLERNETVDGILEPRSVVSGFENTVQTLLQFIHTLTSIVILVAVVGVVVNILILMQIKRFRAAEK